MPNFDQYKDNSSIKSKLEQSNFSGQKWGIVNFTGDTIIRDQMLEKIND
jgi:hypothetical protein